MSYFLIETKNLISNTKTRFYFCDFMVFWTKLKFIFPNAPSIVLKLNHAGQNDSQILLHLFF